MWLTVAKAIATGAIRLLGHPITWILLLGGTTILCGIGWRSQIATTRQVRAECEARAEAAIRQNLELAAEAWQSVFVAHNEAVARLSVAEAAQAERARTWRARYQAALKEPQCAEWAQEPVRCPVD